MRIWTSLSKKEKYVIFISGFFFLLTIILYYNIFAAPRKFPAQTLITIEQGQTLAQAADTLEHAGLVRSSLMLRNIVILVHSEAAVIAGDYFFEQPENVLKIAQRITEGDFGLDPVRVTIPEGSNLNEIADILEEHFEKFNRDEFFAVAEEGYMFPDTYFFLPNATTKDIALKLRQTFDARMQSIAENILQFGRPLDEVVNMAAIVEKEARKKEDRQMIAGILWNRFDDNYPLQVDVAFQYINGKNTYNLTRSDLATTSPYNTYVHPGLPPTPITNPGLEAILATVTPVKSDYYFFLSDKSGTFYYSETFTEHTRKQNLYVRE